MAEHAPTYELVEVKAEDIMAERQSFYGWFTKGTKWAIIGVASLLILLAIFLV